jgi:hypothetical protein
MIAAKSGPIKLELMVKILTNKLVDENWVVANLQCHCHADH